MWPVSTPADLEVHADDLEQIRTTLDGAGRTLFGHAHDLDTAPDAGVSSGEVGNALAALSSAVAGLAQHLGTLSTNVGTANADFTATDGAVSDALRPGGPAYPGTTAP